MNRSTLTGLSFLALLVGCNTGSFSGTVPASGKVTYKGNHSLKSTLMLLRHLFLRKYLQPAKRISTSLSWIDSRILSRIGSRVE